METATTDGAADSKVAFGKAIVGTSAISIEWIKEINNTVYSFRNTSLAVDEFDEFYMLLPWHLSLIIQLKIVFGLVN